MKYVSTQRSIQLAASQWHARCWDHNEEEWKDYTHLRSHLPWSYHDPAATYDTLLRLRDNPEATTAADITAAVGEIGFAGPACDECCQTVLEYIEADNITLCLDCLTKLKIFVEAEQHEGETR